jgi:HD-GYP domain-containing protein (c-di-GMP phosphodiesterase class II)
MADRDSESPPRLRDRVRELEQTAGRLAVLLETGRLLSSEISLDRLLTLVMQQTTVVLDAERSSLFLVDKKRAELWSKIAQGIDDVVLRFPLTRGIAGHVARSGEVVNLADAYQDPRFNPEIDRGTGFRTSSLLVVPLKGRNGEVLGVIQALNKRGGAPFSPVDVEILSALAAQAAVSVENALLYERIEALFEAFVGTIVTAIDARDPTTAGHSHRVAEYALNLARSLHHSGDDEVGGIHFTREQLRALRYASILHDVGKIGVREQVLCKRYTLLVPEIALVRERIGRARAEAELRALRSARALTPDEVGFYQGLLGVVERRRLPATLPEADAALLRRARDEGLLTQRQHLCLTLAEGNLIDSEWEDMKSHVTRSYQILSQIPWPEPLARVPAIAGSHHEKLDGTGYPRGLTADQYPFEGQILCVADIYDALTASDRPYKRSYTPDEAQRILEGEAKIGRVDGKLVRTFFSMGCFELPPGVPLPSPEPPPDAAL